MDKRERNRIARAKWRAEHREEHRASVKAWRLANPDAAREKDRRAAERRKAKKRAAREARLAATVAERAVAKSASAERARVRKHSHYLANREHVLEQSRKWREANPGKSATLQRAWRGKNREKVRANKRSRKAAKRITLVRELTKLQRGRCAYCRTRLADEFHVDHVMPLKRGGPDRRSNLQLTCVPCNLAKSAQHPIAFAQSKGMLL